MERPGCDPPWTMFDHHSSLQPSSQALFFPGLWHGPSRGAVTISLGLGGGSVALGGQGSTRALWSSGLWDTQCPPPRPWHSNAVPSSPSLALPSAGLTTRRARALAARSSRAAPAPPLGARSSPAATATFSPPSPPLRVAGHVSWRIPGTGEPGGLPSMGLWGRTESDMTEVT